MFALVMISGGPKTISLPRTRVCRAGLPESSSRRLESCFV